MNVKNVILGSGQYVELVEIIVLGFVYQVIFFSCATQLKFFSVDRVGQFH
jgi:hypothetical protein